MTILAKDLDYTELDQEALETRIFRLIDSAFPDWTERSRINFGNLLVGALAMIGDVLAFQMNNQSGESRWSTARLRRSLLALVKLVAYRPASARPATVDLTIALPAPLANSVTIAAGQRILTDAVTNPVAYQLLADVVFAPGDTVKVASAENSVTYTELFTSSELPDQVFVLGRAGVVDGSVTLVAADGAFSEVTDLLDSTSTSKHFQVAVDAQDRGAIAVGNGINGSIPHGSITVTYKTTDGVAGRVEPGRLNRIDGSVYDALGTSVRPTVTNVAASSGGDARESNSAIRRNVPRSLPVQARAVSRPDYEVVARQVPGVARAFHLTGNENGAIGENTGQLFIVPDGASTPSQALLDEVLAQFDPDTGPYPKTNTYQLLVAGAPYLDVDVTATVYLASGYTGAAGRARARAGVMAALQAFFALTTTDDAGEVVDNPTVDFGYYFKAADGTPANQLAWSDVFNAVRDAAGIRKVDAGISGFLLNAVRDDVSLAAQDFPRLGDVVLIDGQTGEAF